VAERIASLGGAPATELVTVRTSGDLLADVPLSTLADRAFFTREIEEALVGGEIDLAVHSLKDLATDLPHGLTLGAVLAREDPRDVLVVNDGDGRGLDGLSPGARVGTSSLRRKAFLARGRPDVEAHDLRGNVTTRLQKLMEGKYDAVVLAAAGLKRLGLEGRIGAYLCADRFPPAAGQGALAVEVRADDLETLRWIRPLDDPAARAETSSERALLSRLEGGCQVPVGALAEVRGDRLTLSATVCSLDGRASVDGRRAGDAADAVALGEGLAEELLERGGAEILAATRRPTARST
jgi:hydroxymethylbilane synthase